MNHPTIKINNTIILTCPHCYSTVVVLENEINCKIFRHAVFKNTYKQTNPHESKTNLDTWMNEGKLFGCAKPFQMIQINNEWFTKKCDYI
jgi:hypothetical protein